MAPVHAGSGFLSAIGEELAAPGFAIEQLAQEAGDLAISATGIVQSPACSRWEWARFVAETTGFSGDVRPAKSSEFDSPAERPSYSVLDNFPLEETVGYLLPDWRDATKRFLETRGRVS